MILEIILGFAQAAVPLAAAASLPEAGAPKSAEVKVSTAAVPTSIEEIYTAGRLRDPFLKGASAAAGSLSVKSYNPEDFSIHNLSLRGVMKDAGVDYALFSDMTLGVSFILRKGKLYDYKGRVVPGVSGTMDIKQKMVRLATREKDFQQFRLGAEGKD